VAIADTVEGRDPIFAAGDRFSVDDAGARVQLAERKTFGLPARL
jgi:hypothetical protein